MTAEVNVSLWEDDDAEKAEITMGSFGCVSELRFQDRKLEAVASFTSADLGRLLEALAEAERKRIDPDEKTLEAIEVVRDRFDYIDDDKSRLYLMIELVMPIAHCGSVLLEPNMKAKSLKDWMEEDRDESESDDSLE